MPRASELQLLISEHPADVIAVQESWLTSHNTAPELHGYVWYGVNRSSASPGGGVGFYVHASLSFSVVPVPDVCPVEVAAISIKDVGGRRIYLTSVYVPPRTSTTALQQLKKLRLNSSILFGDFNSHHTTWSRGAPTSRGRALHRLFTSHNMRVFGFKDVPTYIGGAGQFSSPDLVAVGSYIKARIAHPQVLSDVGSDHLPILTQIQCEAEKIEDTRSFWRPHTLDRQDYCEHLGSSLREWQKNHERSDFSPSTAYKEWTACLLEAAELFCKKTSRQAGAGSPPWYRENHAVRRLIRERRRLRRKFQRRRDLASYRLYQDSKSRTDIAIREAKDKDWERHCSTFNKKNMYSRLRGLAGKSTLPAVLESETG